MTRLHVSRRQVLSMSVGIYAGLAGCPESVSRKLWFPSGGDFSKTPEGEWVGDVPVGHETFGSKPEWEAFHDVHLKGFNAERDLVCVTDYGDIPKGKTREREVRCDRFPSILVLTAEESPCDRGTRIEYLVYYEAYNGDFRWKPSFRGCEEGLPPHVEETPVTPTRTPERTPTPDPTSKRTETNATANEKIGTYTNGTNTPSTGE